MPNQNRNLIINTLLEELFHTTTSKSLNTGHPDKSTKTVTNDCYEYPKKPTKTSTLKDQRKTSIETANRFSVLSPDEDPTENLKIQLKNQLKIQMSQERM